MAVSWSDFFTSNLSTKFCACLYLKESNASVALSDTVGRSVVMQGQNESEEF